ncbi:MAG: 5'-nucleotidase C-terminal domain-containing protein [bacterium]
MNVLQRLLIQLLRLSLLLPTLAFSQEAQTTELIMLLTGNTFGYFDVTPIGNDIAGGVIRRKTVIDQLRQQIGSNHMLLLDAGNMMGYYYLLRGDRGLSMIQAMRTIGYDAITVGNHEFDYGKEPLLSYTQPPYNLDIVCGNILKQSSNETFLPSFHIVQKANGVKVAILGLTDPEIEAATLRQNFAGLSMTDPVSIARTLLPKLRNEADIVIALTYLKPDDAYRLASQVPGFDVIVTRADSASASTAVRREAIGEGEQTLIVTPVSLGKALSRVHLNFDHARRRCTASLQTAIPITAELPGDPDFATQLTVGGEQEYYEYCRRTYGMNPDDPVLIVDEDFTNDDLIQVILNVFLRQTGAEIALLNNSLFRFDGIEFSPAGDDLRYRKISLRHLEQILWTENELVTMRLTGQQLAALQARSKSNQSAGRNNYLQHVQVTIAGNDEWFIHNAPLQQKSPPEYYRVVTTNFLAGGGDGYLPFREGQDVGLKFSGMEIPVPSENGYPINIRKFIVRLLRTTFDLRRPVSRNATSLVDNGYRSRQLWRFTLSRLQLSYSAGQYRAAGGYSNVGLTELRGKDFSRIVYEADVRLKQESDLLIWDNRLFAAFGQSHVVEQPIQEITDDLFFESVVNFRSSKATRDITIYPSASLRYDTEITRQEIRQTIEGETLSTFLQRQQDITLGAGVAFSDFSGFSRTRVTLTQTFDRSKNPRPDQNGINIQTAYSTQLSTAFFRTEFDGTYYIRQSRSSGDTRRLLIRWRSDLSIPLGRFYLAPSLNMFIFQGQQSTIPNQSPQVATAIVLGVTLGYSFDWKMQYESLF